jgi:hypothetical protein
MVDALKVVLLKTSQEERKQWDPADGIAVALPDTAQDAGSGRYRKTEPSKLEVKTADEV